MASRCRECGRYVPLYKMHIVGLCDDCRAIREKVIRDKQLTELHGY